jgi:hypothetical protein
MYEDLIRELKNKLKNGEKVFFVEGKEKRYLQLNNLGLIYECLSEYGQVDTLIGQASIDRVQDVFNRIANQQLNEKSAAKEVLDFLNS